jgi:hypothetical protein
MDAAKTEKVYKTDSLGRFTKGTSGHGRKPGVMDRVVRPDSKAAKLTRNLLQASADANLEAVLANVAKEAKTNPKLGVDYARLVAPPPVRLVFVPPEVATLPPEARIPALAALAATGQIDLPSAEALISMAQKEIESAVVGPIRRCLIELAKANRSGIRSEIDSAIVKLANRVSILADMAGTGEVIDG